MLTVANSISLSAPLARVWRVLVDVDRDRDWHPTVGLESDPADPKKLLCTYWRPGWTDPVISADGRIVCLERPCHFAWRVGIKGLLQIEEGFHLKKSRSEEHTSELQSLMRISYAVFCLTKKKPKIEKQNTLLNTSNKRLKSMTTTQ